MPGPQTVVDGVRMASSGLNLRLRGTVYWFRRRVPDSLVERIGRKEILRSLETSSRAEAGLRARAVWLVTERIFGLVSGGGTITREQIDLLLRRLVRESVWNSPSRDELVEDFTRKQDSISDVLFSDEGRSAILNLPGADRERVLQHLERFLDLASARTHEAIAVAADTRADVAELRRYRSEQREWEARIVAVAAQFMQLEERKRLAASGTEPTVIAPMRPAERKAGTAVAAAFAAYQRAYLESRQTKTDDFDSLSPNSLGQAEKTFEVWQELMGDMPVGAVTKVEARRFRSLLRTLPASYGKAAHAVRPLTLKEEIERARARQDEIDRRNALLPPGADREPDLPLLALKTAKRHLSALSAYWQWLETQGYAAEGSNPFVGFKWPGVRKGRQGRNAWSEEHLRTLLTSPRFARGAERGTFWWMTVIGMYSALRLEEIARLRVHHDLKVLHGRLAFIIQEHHGAWNPKTEAGERIVPVHPVLLELGFTEYLERQRVAGGERLFSDLPPRGREGNYGPDFSREFSKYKTALGIPAGTVFHSFRHSVRTILTNAPANLFRDPWIDAVMGHEGDDDERSADGGTSGSRSVGLTVYLKEVDMQNLCAVVDYIHYPVAVQA